MEINAQDTNQASQFIANNPSLEIKKPVNSAEQLNDELGRLADDIYHKNEQQEPEPTYNKSMTITSNNVLSTPEIEQKALKNMQISGGNLYMPGGEVSKSVERMFSLYGTIMAEIATEQPDLADKSWGIAINKSGELEVTGSLSDDEKALIAEKFNGNEDFITAANDFKSSFLKYLDMGAGGWSNFDVNEDNFAKVFDLKELLDNSQGGESFKQAWNKDFSWLELNNNISSQLKRNAEKA